MTTKKTTKRALFGSLAIIALCLIMLVGTTFAWFTDTASTGVNTIQAGTLDVALMMKVGTEWKSAEGQTLDFVKAEGAPADEQILWEPGATYRLPELKIVNNGNLALKYKIVVSGATDATPDNGKDDLKLLDVIDWTYSAAGNGGTDTADALNGERHLAAKAEDTLTIQGKMRETAGNDYQGLAIKNISITVYAAQDTVEYDSNNNQYDKNALYADTPLVAAKPGKDDDGSNHLAGALTEAAQDGDKITAYLETGSYDLTDSSSESSVKAAVQGKEISFVGAGADTVYSVIKEGNVGGEGNGSYSFDGAKSVEFKNMTISFENAKTFQGFIRAGALHFENCTIKGMGSYWGTGEVVFDNCNFVNSGDYNLWTYSGSSFTFNNCTFTSEGKCLNVYRQENNNVVDITLKNCKFINTTSTAAKAAVNIKSERAWNVTIENCTTEGAFPAANSGLWAVSNEAGKDQVTVK